jgi:hypothetical protein
MKNRICEIGRNTADALFTLVGALVIALVFCILLAGASIIIIIQELK